MPGMPGPDPDDLRINLITRMEDEIHVASVNFLLERPPEYLPALRIAHFVGAITAQEGKAERPVGSGKETEMSRLRSREGGRRISLRDAGIPYGDILDHGAVG
jgi:hypothetical protein